jgi:O-antigen/teichoic acid export membrane protein
MSDIARKSLETLLVRLGMQLFSVGGSIVIARVLFAEGRGGFVYAATVLTFGLMATVGHNKAILWQYGRQGLPAWAVKRVMTLVVIGVSVPIVAVLLAVGWLVPSQSALLFVALGLPFAIFSQSAAGLFLADGDVRPNNICVIFPTIGATLIFVPLILFVERRLWVALAVWGASYVAGGIYTMIALRRYPGGGSNVDFKALAKEQVSFGSQACLSSLVQYLDFRIDVFMVMFIAGTTALGIYSVGIAIGEFIWQLSSAMINPALRDIGGKDYDRAADVTAKCMRHSFALVFIASVLVAAFARPVVPLIFGPAFSYGAVITIALLPGIIAYSMMPALTMFFSQQLGQPRIPFYFSALSVLVCALLTGLTLPHYGIIAASIATSVSYSCAFIAAAIYFCRRTGTAWTNVFAFSLDDLRPYRSLLATAAGAMRIR